MTNDLTDIGEVAHHGPEDVFIAVMTLLGSFALMASINLQLALLTFVIVPVMAWLVVFFGKPHGQHLWEAVRQRGQLQCPH